MASTVLKARRRAAVADRAAGLRTRIAANLGEDLRSSRAQDLKTLPLFGWTGRLSAFAAAAMVMLTLSAVLLPIATVRSTAVLAAQLALDHLKCFTIDGDADGQPIAKADAEATLLRDFNFSVSVPASLPSAQLDLLAVRRCLYGDGLGAHCCSRHGEPVSLFIPPWPDGPRHFVFGHDHVVDAGAHLMCWWQRRLSSELYREVYLRT